MSRCCNRNPRGVTLDNASASGCRWPVGEDRRGQHLFCDMPRLPACPTRAGSFGSKPAQNFRADLPSILIPAIEEGRGRTDAAYRMPEPFGRARSRRAWCGPIARMGGVGLTRAPKVGKGVGKAKPCFPIVLQYQELSRVTWRRGGPPKYRFRPFLHVSKHTDS